MIEISGLCKAYGKAQIRAVDELNLSVREGEIFGFIGPNGAGKTTTIKMLTGILPPDAGSISLCGIDLFSQSVEAKRNVGYVPDTHEIYDRLTGLEFLHFLGDIFDVPMDVRRERMDKYLTMFALEGAAPQLIKTYSHGMKQKILLTGALLHDPALWVLDEPMTGLDPKAAHALKLEMRAHCDKGNTVFFSTHILEVAEKLCDRVGIISKGRLVAVGTMEELLNKKQGSSLESYFLELTQEAEGAEE